MPTTPEEIAASASAKFMNDNKWRKLFGVLDQCRLVIFESHWTYLGKSGTSKHRGFPKIADLAEDGFRDTYWGPMPFLVINTITIPRLCDDWRQDRTRPLPAIHQPIEELDLVLRQAGSFPVAVTESGLTITAYRFDHDNGHVSVRSNNSLERTREG